MSGSGTGSSKRHLRNPTALYDTGPADALLARHEHATYPFRCRFGDVNLEIDRSVFCPTMTRTAPLLLESVDFHGRMRALDVFAGSGAFGIIAALHGAAVVTVDIAPLAVACTTRNCWLNDVASRVDPRVGTMAECLAPHEVFDLIIANPPLLPGEPNGPLEAAIYDPQLRATHDLIARLPAHLSQNGECYLLSSSVLDQTGPSVESVSTARGLTCMTTAQLGVGDEVYRVHRITHSS